MRAYTIKEIKDLWLYYKTPMYVVELSTGIQPEDFIKQKPGLVLFTRNKEGIKQIDRFSGMSFPDFIEFHEKNIESKKKEE